MKRRTKLVLAALASGALLTGAALAHGEGGWWGGRRPMMGGAPGFGPQGYAPRGFGRRGYARQGFGPRGFGPQGYGPRGHGGMPGGFPAAFDADKDGRITPEEAKAGFEALVSKYDADGNGTLSMDEFRALHEDRIRERMARAFQAIDRDGNGQISAEELGSPAQMAQRMHRQRPAGRGGWNGWGHRPGTHGSAPGGASGDEPGGEAGATMPGNGVMNGGN